MKLFLLKRDNADFHEIIERAGVDSYCIDLLNNKTRTHVFLMKDAKIEQANIIKQTALSVGCDAAVHRDVISGKQKLSDCIIMCNESQLEKIAVKLEKQPFSLGRITADMLAMIKDKPVWKIRGRDYLAEKDYLIMGILNATPDSFYDGGKYNTLDHALKHCEYMIQNGADIIDIGGESTRPFSEPVDEEEENKRVIPIVNALRKHFSDILISVDTNKSQIARDAADAGADIINDISGFTYDDNMINIIKSFNLSAVAMHIKGLPRNMQDNPVYNDLMTDITSFLEESVSRAVNAGIQKETIVIDPGIGFGKTVLDNFRILDSIDVLKTLKRPVLIGASNKSFIGKSLEAEPDERTEGTLSANVWAYSRGASIFRVHDVPANKKALEIARRLKHV